MVIEQTVMVVAELNDDKLRLRLISTNPGEDIEWYKSIYCIGNTVFIKEDTIGIQVPDDTARKVREGVIANLLKKKEKEQEAFDKKIEKIDIQISKLSALEHIT